MACCESRDITIKATRDSAGEHHFAMFENGQPVIGDELVSKKNGKHSKEDYHKFTFTLENVGDSNLVFEDNPFDVMWVEAGNATTPGKCPKKRKTDEDFIVADVTADKLTVYNANHRGCMHQFVLNFIGILPDGTKGRVPYDPVWTNGNGGN